MFLSTIVVDGRVAGTWKRTVKKDHVAIVLSGFGGLSARDLRLLEAPAEMYGRFVGLPVRVGVGSV
jgi:hypothetical protein